MNRPGLSDYIAGNAVTLTAVSGVTAVASALLYKPAGASRDGVMGVPRHRGADVQGVAQSEKACRGFPGLGAGVERHVWRCAATEGSAPGGRVRTLLFFIVWSALLCWLASHAAQKDSQAYGGVSFCFLLLSLWAAGGALQRAARWVSRPRSRKSAKPAPEGEFIVSVCPARPWRSPSIRQITAALPKYARELLLTHRSVRRPRRAATRSQLLPPSIDRNGENHDHPDVSHEG